VFEMKEGITFYEQARSEGRRMLP